jgi:hypothetical protein
MSWDTIFDDFFEVPFSPRRQSQMLRRLDAEVERLRASDRVTRRDESASQSDLRAEVEVLHPNFARSLLLLQALTTTLLRKQLITREELQALIKEIDLLDGEPDSSLDPAALPGMQPRRSPESLEGMALRALQEGDSTSPREFLKQLENRDEPRE